MKKILLFISILLVSVMMMSCGKNENEDNREVLVVGLECAYQPFNWTDTKASELNYPIAGTNKFADGYDIQIAKMIAEALNMRLVIKQIDWDGLIPSTTSGMIDLIIAGMSATEDRKVDIDFTEKYYSSEYVFLTSKTNKYASINQVEQLAGATLIGQNGTLYKQLVDALAYQKVVTAGEITQTVPEIVTKILGGFIDGTILEKPVATGLVAADANLVMIEFADGHGLTKILEEDENGTEFLRDIVSEDLDVCIGIAKGREDLKTRINSILANITTEQREQIMAQAVNRVSE